MRLAARDKVTTILSKTLLEGIHTSQVWSNEREHSLTQTLCLFWPEYIGDFIIDLIVSKPSATAVWQAIRQSNSASRVALGDFLFDGVMESACIKNGGKLTDAVTTLHYEDEDWVVRVVLSHAQGWHASRVFPSTE